MGFKTGAIIVSWLAGAALAVAKNTTLAKNYPGAPTYPNEVAWSSLKEATSNRLQKCPLTGPNAPACGASSLQADYVLLAQSAEDISKGLSFATKNNLRVTVRNTGHDFMARHSGEGALTVVTGGMKGSEWTDTWTPTAGSPEFKSKQVALKQPAVVINAGNTWFEVISAVNKKGHAVVHGADPTVGASGGWTMGGGHGPYSNQYGLGCDNALEFEVVLTNGTIVTTNDDSYPDLFFALRGGGGSTFGVVTKTTMKTFPSPSMNTLMLLVKHGSTGLDGYLNAMAYFFAMTPNLTDFGMSGYPVMSSTNYMGALTAPGKSNSEISTFFDPIAAKMRSYGANLTLTSGTRLGGLGSLFGGTKGGMKVPDILSDYLEQRNLITDSRERSQLDRRQMVNMTPVHQTRVNAMASRLLATSSLNEDNIPAIKKMLSSITGYLLPYGNAGGMVARNRNLDIGLNPAWREASMHLIVINYNVTNNVRAMDPLSLNHAAYFNEALDFEDDWKTTFWGPKEHYARLLAVKHKYDPTNTLWCFPCVGGDVFAQQEGKLYLRD